VTASRRRCHFHAGFFFWAARNVIPNEYLTDARRAEPIDMRYLAKRATFVGVKRTSLKLLFGREATMCDHALLASTPPNAGFPALLCGITVALATGGGNFGPGSLRSTEFGVSNSAGGWSSNRRAETIGARLTLRASATRSAASEIDVSGRSGCVGNLSTASWRKLILPMQSCGKAIVQSGLVESRFSWC
jgi:hypothetical protein